jgi:hypothetical protein
MKKRFSGIYSSVRDSLRDLSPILIVISFFQLFVLRQPVPNAMELLGGIVLVVLGLSLFVRGLELGLFPIGQSMAYDFARKGSLLWMLLFAFALGFGTTGPAIGLVPGLNFLLLPVLIAAGTLLFIEHPPQA